jgi:hypothetical protein
MKRVTHTFPNKPGRFYRTVRNCVDLPQDWTRLFMRKEQTIENMMLPSCNDCVFHIPKSGLDYASALSKCSKFGKKDIVTGKISYDYLSSCRTDETKCGVAGKYFRIDEHLQFKIAKHIFFSNILYILPIVIVLLSVVIRR